LRAEDVVGVCFFLGLFAGIALIVYGSQRPTQSHRRPFWIGVGLGAMAVAFLLFTLATIYLLRTSARPEVEGNVWGISGSGPRTHGSQFRVTTASGDVVMFHTSSHELPRSLEGERVRARYVVYNRKVIEFAVLSGPYGAWAFREPDGQLQASLLGIVGLICGMGAYGQLRKSVPAPAPAA